MFVLIYHRCNNKVYCHLSPNVHCDILTAYCCHFQAIRLTICTVSFISQSSTVIGAFWFFNNYWSIVLASSCSLNGPLLYRSPIVMYFDRGHPYFRNFSSAIPVDVITVTPYVIRSLTLHVYQWGSNKLDLMQQSLHRENRETHAERIKEHRDIWLTRTQNSAISEPQSQPTFVI